jgi:hypothetical protein
MRDVFKYHLGRIRGTVWQGSLRQRFVPLGSKRERKVVNFYPKTIGRLIGE